MRKILLNWIYLFKSIRVLSREVLSKAAPTGVAFVFCALGIVFLSGCASQSPNSAFKLVPQSTTDGSKRFTYEFATDGRRAAPGNPLGSSNRGSNQMFGDMEDSLELEIEASGYCLEGYFVYDRAFDGTTYILRGECQD